MIKNKSFFKIIVLLVIISFSSVQPAWARGRRGGNSSGDLAIAAAGGAAMPLGAVAGAYIAGGAVGTGAYNAALSSSASAMAAGGVTTAGLTAAGVDQHTTQLISAGVSGMAGGLSSISSAELTGRAATAQLGQSVAGSMVASEVGYQLNDAGVPLSSAIGSVAGSFAGGFAQGALSPTTNELGKSVSKSFSEAFSDGLSTGAGYAIDTIASNIGYAVASDLVSDAIVDLAGERSLARPYAGYIGGLGGRLTGHFADAAISGEPSILSPDFGKQEKFGWVRPEQSFAERRLNPNYKRDHEKAGYRFMRKDGELREYEPYPQLYKREIDGRFQRALRQSQSQIQEFGESQINP